MTEVRSRGVEPRAALAAVREWHGSVPFVFCVSNLTDTVYLHALGTGPKPAPLLELGITGSSNWVMLSLTPKCHKLSCVLLPRS